MAALGPIEKSRVKIARLLKRVNRQLNILLLGETETGKSAFVDSIAASLSGEWYSYTTPKTKHLTQYHRCCRVDSDEFENVILPTLIDTPGLYVRDDNDEKAKEILKLLLTGRIPDKEPFETIVSASRVDDLEELRHKYSTVDPSMEVDIILLLVSANIIIPENLIKCVVDVAKHTGRGVPVYGVLTKSDRVPLGSDIFKQREAELCHLLYPDGRAQSVMRCSNYCKEFTPNRMDQNDQTIDSAFLKFLEQIIAPAAAFQGEVRLNPSEIRANLVERVKAKRTQIENTLKDAKVSARVAIFGTPGTGKSAFVNSIAAAVSDSWREIAISGLQTGTGKAQTFVSKSFPNCGVLDEAKIATHKFLPTLVDYPGFSTPGQDEKDWYCELIKIILYGRMPEGELLEKAIKIGKTSGRSGLRRAYPKSVPSRKVNRVIILGSAAENLPDSLIECVMEAARPSAASSHRRSVPVFGVLTKSDTVNNEREAFKEKEDKFKELLEMKGSEQRFLRCVNYCGKSAPMRTEENYPELDLPILAFLDCLVNPNLAVDHDNEVDDYTWLEKFDSLMRNGIDFAASGIKMWLPLLISVILHFLVTMNSAQTYRKVEAKAFEIVCMKFNDSSEATKTELADMEKICMAEQSSNVTMDFYLQLAWPFLFGLVSLLLRTLYKSGS